MHQNRIKILRTVKDITQKEMADQMHKSEAAYGRLENKNVADIPTKDLADIAAILGCTREDLLKEGTAINIIEKNENDFTNIDDKEIIAQFNDMLQTIIRYQEG